MSKSSPCTLRPERLEVSAEGEHRVPYGGPGRYPLGALQVEVGGDAPARLTWRIHNHGDAPIRIRAVALVCKVEASAAPLRMFRHGYQSWSGSDVAIFGTDQDPSTLPGAFEFMQDMHHADPRPARAGELRAEMVTLVRSGASDPLLVGFEGGRSHDGTLRLRPGADGPELWVEAYLGDAVLPPGSTRDLHGVTSAHGADACALLEGWADALGTRENARRTGPYQAGWCPWYQYFHDITEATLRDNLAACDGWPIEVFQVDDGYQRAIGDWRATNERFPSGLDRLAADIAGAGFVPGLWLAPFLAAPESTVAREHNPWLARTPDGNAPLPGMFNAHWSQAQGGVVWALDTTHPEVHAHLVQLARDLRQQGWRYFKLDFSMAAAFEGTFHDATRTPAERVRAGYDAFREGAGEDALILACGAPMGHVVGVADAARIGCDVAPTWGLGPDALPLGPYDPTQPSTRHALRDTLARSFMHRRLWVNDPDCVMLRRTDTALTDAQRRTWARAVGLSGGLAVLSDDMARLDGEARGLFDEVLALGRAADAEAQAGRTPRCPNLLAPDLPPRLTSAAGTLEVSLETGECAMTRG